MSFNYLQSCLESYPMFDHLTDDQKVSIFTNLKFVKVKLGEKDNYLFKQGDDPENFYIVVKGGLILEIDGFEKKRFI
jgi:CRP-like cAMP-binding protein